MKFPALNPYYRASLVLIAAAIVLVLIAILTDRRDLTSAALVVSALVCLITGIFLATLSSAEPLDIRFVSLLSVQGCINLCRVCADLGIAGNAVFLPPSRDRQDRIMQFIPVSTYDGAPLQGDSFVIVPGSAGLLVVPAAAPLLREIRERHQLVVPQDVTALSDVIREVGEDLLEVADRVTTDMGDTTITVTLEGYRLIAGCMAVQAESPRCCLVNPCPVCSLVACLLVQGTGSIVQVERCSPDAEHQSVTTVFSLVSSS